MIVFEHFYFLVLLQGNVIPAGTTEQAQVAEVLQDVITQLAGGGKLKPSHIKKIYKSFQAVDKDGSGYVDYHEFLEVLKQKDSHIMKQVFKCFDLDFNGEEITSFGFHVLIP